MKRLDSAINPGWLLALAMGVALAAACGGSDGEGGPSGATGTAGPAGATGPAGTPGATGPVGTAGPTGPAGKDGSATNQGATGATGPVGPAGKDGTAGKDGPAGPAGATVVVSEIAKKGLDIAPVKLAIDGKTAAEVEAIGRGSYLVNAVVGCGDCHNQQKPDGTSVHLGGGASYELIPGTATVYARNLTPDAKDGMKLTEDQFIESLRTGKDQKDGSQLIVMPWPVFRWASTADLKAIYAYLKAVPAVSNTVPADIKGPLAAAKPVPFPSTYDEGDVARPLPPEAGPTGAPIADPGNVARGRAIQPLAEPAGFKSFSPTQQALFARGSYLVNALSGCNDCHSNPARDNTTLKINTAGYLSGGGVWAVPPGLDGLLKQTRTMTANLTGQNNGYKADFVTFMTTITTGTHANGTPLGFPMPAATYANMTLQDLEALYTYITNVPARTGANDKKIQGIARFCGKDGDCNTAAGETCNVATKECVGKTCATKDDCDACQSCTATKCAAPAAGDACLTSGI